MARGLSTTPVSHDGYFEKDRIQKAAGDSNNRDFTYFMLGGTRMIYASAVRLALVKVRGGRRCAGVDGLATAQWRGGHC